MSTTYYQMAGRQPRGGSFFFLTMPHGLWDLSYPNRDPTQATAVKVPKKTTGPPGNSLEVLSLIQVTAANG